MKWKYRLTNTEQGRYCCWSNCCCPVALSKGDERQLLLATAPTTQESEQLSSSIYNRSHTQSRPHPWLVTTIPLPEWITLCNTSLSFLTKKVLNLIQKYIQYDQLLGTVQKKEKVTTSTKTELKTSRNNIKQETHCKCSAHR